MARNRTRRPEEERLSLYSLMERSWERPTARDRETVLRALPLFANVSPRHLKRVSKLAEFVDFRPGEFIVNVGEPGDAFYVIVSGNAKAIGRPRAETLGPGDFFGEMALLDGEPRSTTITATTELHAMRIPRKPFLKLLEQDSKMALAVMQALAARIRRLDRTD